MNDDDWSEVGLKDSTASGGGRAGKFDFSVLLVALCGMAAMQCTEAQSPHEICVRF